MVLKGAIQAAAGGGHHRWPYIMVNLDYIILTCQARCANWCNKSMSFMGVTILLCAWA